MNIDRSKLYYLASPYSKYPDGLEAACRDVCKVAARLISDGFKVYSPIAHTHQIAVYGGLDPLDHSVWLSFDEAIMARCDGLIVVKMVGWQDSYGVAYEAERFKDRGIDPIYIDAETPPRATPVG